MLIDGMWVKKFLWYIFIVLLYSLLLIIVEIVFLVEFCVIVIIFICVWVNEVKNLVVKFLWVCMLLFIKVIIVRLCCICIGLIKLVCDFNLKVVCSVFKVSDRLFLCI